jgi:hypothetical protein
MITYALGTHYHRESQIGEITSDRPTRAGHGQTRISLVLKIHALTATLLARLTGRWRGMRRL